MAKSKICTKCKMLKSKTEFHKDKGQKNGYSPRCKKCRAKYAKEFRESPKGQKQKDYAKKPDVRERNIECSKQYRKSGKKKISARKYHNSQKGRNYYLKHYYGITIEQYAEILLKQKGVCAICGLPETAPNGYAECKPLSVDHDHNTGLIRGLLCMKCNMMLGSACENPINLFNGIKYLKEHKSSHASQ